MTMYQGQCFCGDVHFTLQGEPLFAQYCHCNKCREVMAVSQRPEDKQGYAYTLAYNTSNLTITTGKEFLEGEVRNQAILYHCQHCNSQIYGIAKDEQYRQTIGLNGNNFEKTTLMLNAFQPIRHVYFENRLVHDFDDDELPKFVDMPKELGGSGRVVI